MGKITQRRRIRTKYRKSAMKKDASGHYHCPTCGAFRGTGRKKKR